MCSKEPDALDRQVLYLILHFEQATQPYALILPETV